MTWGVVSLVSEELKHICWMRKWKSGMRRRINKQILNPPDTESKKRTDQPSNQRTNHPSSQPTFQNNFRIIYTVAYWQTGAKSGMEKEDWILAILKLSWHRKFVNDYLGNQWRGKHVRVCVYSWVCVCCNIYRRLSHTSRRTRKKDHSHKDNERQYTRNGIPESLE